MNAISKFASPLPEEVPASDIQQLFAAETRRPGGIALSISGLSKRFGETEVLRGVDLAIAEGEFVAIVGRSGCGKSTLLRILAGLDLPTSGEVTLGDDRQKTGPGGPARLMFQEPRLLPWSKVLGNVEVGLGKERGRPDAAARAYETLRAVGLEARADAWPSVLSGGQKQRVALARALVSQPRFLALDEPLGALDALTRIEMQSLLESVWQAQGFTAVLVTHDVLEALTLADRVVLIENGQVSLDITVDLPRPRRRGSAKLVALEETILKQLIPGFKAAPDYVI